MISGKLSRAKTRETDPQTPPKQRRRKTKQVRQLHPAFSARYTQRDFVFVSGHQPQYPFLVRFSGLEGHLVHRLVH